MEHDKGTILFTIVVLIAGLFFVVGSILYWQHAPTSQANAICFWSTGTISRVDHLDYSADIYLTFTVTDAKGRHVMGEFDQTDFQTAVWGSLLPGDHVKIFEDGHTVSEITTNDYWGIHTNPSTDSCGS